MLQEEGQGQGQSDIGAGVTLQWPLSSLVARGTRLVGIWAASHMSPSTGTATLLPLVPPAPTLCPSWGTPSLPPSQEGHILGPHKGLFEGH